MLVVDIKKLRWINGLSSVCMLRSRNKVHNPSQLYLTHFRTGPSRVSSRTAWLYGLSHTNPIFITEVTIPIFWVYLPVDKL